MKIFGSNQLPRKLFWKKKFSTENSWWKYLVETYSRWNGFGTIKNFRPKIFRLNQLPGKWFCYHKKFSTKEFFIKIFGSSPLSRKWFWKNKKFSTKKFLMKIFASNLFSRKWFWNNKKFSMKNFCFKPISEEMILQTKKID